MTTENLENFFEENGYKVSVEHGGLETWTKNGVNMLYYLEPFTIESFEEIVNSFDIDEEIELHRQSTDFCKAFTISQSVEDFTNYHNRLKFTLHKLKLCATNLESDKKELAELESIKKSAHEASKAKSRLSAAIKKQFKKESDSQTFFCDAELIEIYADLLSTLIGTIPNNVNGETYLSDLVSE